MATAIAPGKDDVKDGLDQERLTDAAERVRSLSGLGRSDRLDKLFDYILQRTLLGEAPKEIEIAADVFGKTGADVIIDASVRVYAHRLRRKLESDPHNPQHIHTVHGDGYSLTFDGSK